MSEKAPNQASSKDDLDQLSALEESMASFGMGDLDSEHGVILKDWSAQDFANIYVRFRPHLISHARKFLREETQAEEVVQDAFLYLMTALPELDSELGVLRFLKWKTKMLCLDIIRSSQAGLNNNLVPLPDDVADETQPLDYLERADDAAVIRLALAKLKPVHREALIATLYEEKANSAVARQMGLSDNAFRQLLFRARASLKSALVGEAVTAGKSVSEILSIAARKAAQESGKKIIGAGALAIALGFLLSANPLSFLVTTSEVALIPAEKSEVRSDETGDRASDWLGSNPVKSQLADGLNDSDVRETPEVETLRPFEDNPLSLASKEEKSEPNPPTTAKDEGGEQLRRALDATYLAKLAFELSAVEPVSSGATYVYDPEAHVKAFVAYDLQTENVIQHVFIVFEVDGNPVTAVPTISLSEVEREGTVSVSFAATDLAVGDFDGNYGYAAVSDSLFSRSGVLIEMVFDSDGLPVSATLELDPRT